MTSQAASTDRRRWAAKRPNRYRNEDNDVS
jgi:hypothetical protein